MSEIRMLGASTAPFSDEQLAGLYEVRDRAVPWLRANFISSADGAATHDGLSAGLGTPADRRVFDVLRWLADAVVVGAGTIRAEGYGGVRLGGDAVAWRVARDLPEQPVFVIVSRRLDLETGSAVFADAARRPIVVTCAGAPADRRAALSAVADVVDCGDTSVDTVLMKTVLAERGLTQLHSEGGPHLFGAMIEEGSIDELCVTISPRLEGGTARRIADGHLPAGRELRLEHALAADDGTLLLRYRRA